MISLLPTTTIDLATAPTDLRKAYDGLAVLVRQSLGQDPLNGSLYVFCNRRRDRIKILFWEEGGYWFCARRLGEDTFRWPQQDGACARYRREELLLLLGGIDLEQTRERQGYRREVTGAEK
jgi:transposase